MEGVYLLSCSRAVSRGRQGREKEEFTTSIEFTLFSIYILVMEIKND